MSMVCPYCDIEISEKQVEAEDGCCPECGALIMTGGSMSDDDEDMYNDEEFSDEEFDDQNNDMYEDEEFSDEEFDDLDEKG